MIEITVENILRPLICFKLKAPVGTDFILFKKPLKIMRKLVQEAIKHVIDISMLP